ncbi:TRAP transporter small permease [Aureimonas jatrophae]|uniref:TRAP transporter small permease protein n=1 Tax=Aureimonas jatrophae TaxID=1166073 RepID=A0A1H0KUE7_9HYPH|nr:TRAP transporter small permease [Aureimonas jatrophae]MBB3948874.1 TRAP-type C4-dicarboxylate transport system permease small subunit [Aureimonas jatrophae]SDO59416.1 TRAP-type C4-dicarboxylate transport system, small permease component [Aureimonas jatrophae]
MRRIVEAYFALLRLAIAGLLAAMVILVFGNVVLRYGFNSGITSSEELSRLAFVWLIFLGAALALRDHAHIGIDTLIRMLPAALARPAVLLGYALMLLACVLLLQGVWGQLALTWATTTPVTGISIGWFLVPALVFAVTALGLLLAEGIGIATGRVDLSHVVLVQESEDQPMTLAEGGHGAPVR